MKRILLASALSLICGHALAAASDYPNGVNATGTEKIYPVLQNGSDATLTVQQILAPIGGISVTPTGGASGTLANLLSGGTPLPSLQTSGTPSLKICNQLSVIAGGCPLNPWEYVNFVTLVTTSQGSGVYEVGGDFEMHTVTGSGGGASPANSKVALTYSNIAESGGGNVWGAAGNVILRSGWSGSFATNLETDIENDSGHDCAPGGGVCNVFGQFVNFTGAQMATIGFQLSGGVSSTHYGGHYGFSIGGEWVVKDVGYNDSSDDGVSYESQGNHSGGSAFYDISTGHDGFQANGTYALSAFDFTGTSQVGVDVEGTSSVAAISTGANSASISLITKDGQKICIAGTTDCFYHNTSAGKWYWTSNSNTIIASLDEGGDWKTLGTQTASTAP